jgi:thiol-disulfide isomerase/thioredoxin
MVDWDRVELLRSRGWDWDRIAADPKVGFHPETSVKDSGRALRGLYHRQKSREGRKGREEPVIRPSKEDKEATERKWNLPRIGYLVTPIIGIWFLLAYVAPSPVGILVPAFPWLAIGFAGAAFVLLFGLLRNPGRRWSPVFRTTLIAGIVLGLFVSGLVGVTGYLAFGCPYLPPASTLAGLPGPGWAKANVGAWQEGGKPVMYFYGASWCPYCSASSWAIYKALTEFGSVSGADGAIQFSSLSDVYAGTPEIVIANLGFSSSTVSLVVTEDTSGVDGTFPGTNNCFEQAYVGAYSAGSIPFLVVNGQYVHGGSTIVDPALLASYTYSQTGGSGAGTMLSQVQTENGSGWNVVSDQAWWIMAFLTVSSGKSVQQLATEYGWSKTTQNEVTGYVSQI